MIALIDADVVCYRIGFTTQDIDSFALVKYRINEMVEKILEETFATEFRLFLSDTKENNFRYQIDPTYKGNRIQPKPKWHEHIKEYLITDWGAEIAYGCEADDFLGIYQDKDYMGYDLNGMEVDPVTVIATIDKDLKMIPGRHYNFVKKEWDTVSEEQGKLSFYRSIMVGDVSDNIIGVWQVGPKKTEKIIPAFISDESCIASCINQFMVIRKQQDGSEWGYGFEQAKEKVRRNAQLLKIKQSQEEPLFDFPESKLMEELLQSFTLKTEAELSQSTVPITAGMMPSDGFPQAGQNQVDTI